MIYNLRWTQHQGIINCISALPSSEASSNKLWTITIRIYTDVPTFIWMLKRESFSVFVNFRDTASKLWRLIFQLRRMQKCRHFTIHCIAPINAYTSSISSFTFYKSIRWEGIRSICNFNFFWCLNNENLMLFRIIRINIFQCKEKNL